jgi:tRNA A37 methylthiotransferase MiaB
MNLGLISLGCAKNRIDSELFLGVAKKYGLKIVEDLNDADIIVVNTCGFIESAKQEAIDTILDVCENRKNNVKIIAMGCLVERYLDDLKREIPEVDIYFPIRDYNNINELFNSIKTIIQ